MATPSFGDNSKKYLAKYECRRCDEKWKVRNSSGNSKPCDQCHAYISPYKKEEIKYLATYSCKCGYVWESKCTDKESQDPSACKICHKEVDPKRELLRPRRMFGEYNCFDCDKSWKSGNSWEGEGQQCKECMKMILPTDLRPLRPSGNHKGPPHREDLCEKCKKLGYNCRNFKPKAGNDDDEDDQSVQSFGSFTTDRSEGGYGDVTPTASDDEEDLDDMLARKLNLK